MEERLPKDYLLGVLRAALRPSRIERDEVRKVLKLISLQGYNPVELYREALRDRPDNYEAPPKLVQLLPRDLPKEKQLDAALGEVLRRRSLTKKQRESLKPRTAPEKVGSKTPPQSK